MSDRANLELELFELRAANEKATSWGAAVGARFERIKQIEGELQRMDSSAGAPPSRQVPMAILEGQIERLRKNDFAGMETMRTFALNIIDDLLDTRATAEPSLPEAWQCSDALHPYLLGHITQNRDTIKAWESGGIEYVALVPANRSRSAASTVKPAADADVMAWLKTRWNWENDEFGVIATALADIRANYPAPTTSPEPPFDLAAFQKEAETWETVESEQSSHSGIPNHSNCSKSYNGSPEPDALRRAIEELYAWWDLDGSVGSASEIFERHRPTVDATLSRPAPGGWLDAMARAYLVGRGYDSCRIDDLQKSHAPEWAVAMTIAKVYMPPIARKQRGSETR